MKSHTRIPWGAVLLVLAACPGRPPESTDSPPGSSDSPPQLTTVSVTCAPSTVASASSALCSASAADQYGAPFTVPGYTWTSSDEHVAKVDAQGTASTLGAGTVTITASATAAGVTKQGQTSLIVTQGAPADHTPSVHSTPITTDETWHARDNPHVVHGVLTVGGTSATLVGGASASPTLTLEPGVEVRFDEDAQLIVDQGALKAPGTAEQPIRLEANQSVPTPGFWRGLQFTEAAGSSLLEHVTLSDCGRDYPDGVSTCLDLVNTTLVVRDVLVRNSAARGVSFGDDGELAAGSARLSVSGCKTYPVSIEADHVGALPTGGLFTDNGLNTVIVFNGVSHSQTWPNLGVPYDLVGPEVNIVGTVSAPTTLTLSAGTVLRFSSWTSLDVGAGSFMRGPGDLIVNGTEEAPVRFTSMSGFPKPGDWGGVVLGQISSATRISHAIIEYAGSSNPGGNLNLSVDASSCTDCPTLDHVTLQKSSAYGLTAQGGWLGSGSTGVTIRDNASYAIFASADNVEDLHVGAALTLSGNLHDSVGISGNVMHSQTWKNLGIPYDILGHLTVGEFSSTPTTLTLSAGIVLRFAPLGTLDVGGYSGDVASLIVNGTEEAPVLFTSSSSPPKPGDWGGVNLNGSLPSAIRLSHTIIEYAGHQNPIVRTGNLNLIGYKSSTTLDHVILQKSSSYGLVLQEGQLAPASTAVTVRDNGSYAIHAPADLVGSLPSDMTFGGNSPDAVDVYYGYVTQTQTWPGLGVPYILAGGLDVQSYGSSAVTLTLAPGAELRFPQDSELLVQSGSLRAVGTATAPIRFVPTTPTPFKGFWRGIHLESKGNRLDYAFISHGGASGDSLQGNLNVYQEDGGFVTHSTFSNGGVCGIMVRAPSSYDPGVTTDFTLPMYNNTFLDNANAPQCSN